MESNRINVVVVGLGFGAKFVPIFLEHPGVASVAICDTDVERLKSIAGAFGIEKTFSRMEEVIQSREIDAVHLTTGIPDHAKHTLAVLESGKHCACAVPMATSIEDLHAIVALQQKTGLNYMMMETSVYTRPYLYAAELMGNGEFGRVQFLRGAHYQDMEGWPLYWAGLPPMWYATHAISPLLALTGSRAVKVHCFGSGEMREELREKYGNPYPIETAIFQLEAAGISAEVTRSLFDCARPYMESFTVYGENACYEWQMEDEHPMLFRMNPVIPGESRKLTVERPEPPDRAGRLPSSVRRFTSTFLLGNDDNHLSVEQGGGHHGSHPHLVHEFILSILERRKPSIDSITGANWTAAGICAHESAMKNGAEIVVPDFD